MSTPTQLSDLPPGASTSATRVARALMRPIDRFLELEAASGLLLLIAAAAALLWANSPWASLYRALWETPIHAGIADFTAGGTLHFVINDVLMAVFFFAVGIEIRRELHSGALRDVRRAALPVVAAVGGMAVPAALYLALNGGAMARGWGIPMATDIAFAVGVLALLGPRVPASMRVFLLVLAIVDDIGAVLVIALFYSTSFEIAGVVLALAGMGAIITLQRLGARHPVIYGVPAVAIWLGVYHAGIHPAIAGVIVGLMTPAVAWYAPQRFLATARENLEAISERAPPASTAGDIAEPIRRLHHGGREVFSPVERAQRAVHPWVAFAIMPLFAFANAGVDLAGVDLAAVPTVAAGVAAGLLIGKPLGIVAATAIAVRLGIGSLPGGLTWRGVIVVGAAAGIGFTMSLFVAELAFAGQAVLQGAAKLAVLISSAVAGGGALLLGRALLRWPIHPWRRRAI